MKWLAIVGFVRRLACKLFGHRLPDSASWVCDRCKVDTKTR